MDIEEEDIAYEEDIIRQDNSLRSWQRYIDHKIKTKASSKQVRIVFERALKLFNRSYKLWYNYLKYRRRILVSKPPTDIAYSHLADAYERCLVFLNKMPRIWVDYCELQIRRGFITETRRVFDRAIRALPITQHMRIWPLYINFVISHNIPETAVRIYRRYLKVYPAGREDFIEYLKSIDKLDEAANQLVILVNEDKQVSEKGKTGHQLWTELCELISKNPNKIFSLNVDPIIRQGINRYSDQVGILWLALAEYYIRIPNFEKARDIYEEAMICVKTVRDFSQIFDAYSKFMERITSHKMNALRDARPEEMEERELELELMMRRFEHLMDRRPLLLNSVLLRQNPHNVHEWLNRVEILDGLPNKQIETFQEAVRSIDVKHQVGKLSALWVAYANLYEKLSRFSEAREIFEKAILMDYNKVDELATVWCEYGEFELRNSDYQSAIAILKRATTVPSKRGQYFDEGVKVQHRVFQSLRLWSFLADLEESFGTMESCKAVYERIMELRIATPQIIINYTTFLESRSYFEESFKAFERGIGLFKWPIVFDIWNIYLTKFIDRYGGKKLERARDLFEQCLDKCPPKFSKNIFLLYAKLEEENSSTGRVMAIYNRAVNAVEREEMHLIYNIYVKKAIEYYGATKARPIFEAAIECLPEDRSREFSLRYAQMERSLGEIDRARAIYVNCSEICDPRVHPQFWDTWQEFEVKHGNEDTIRTMLRMKRSVQATYNTKVNFMSYQMHAGEGSGVQSAKLAGELSAADKMAQLEAQAQQMLAQETAQKKTLSGGDGRISFIRGESRTTKATETDNPEEINIDDIQADDNDDEDLEK